MLSGRWDAYSVTPLGLRDTMRVRVDEPDRLWIGICFHGISLSDQFGHWFFLTSRDRYGILKEKG